MGSPAGWFNTVTSQFTTTDPTSVVNPLHQLAPAQTAGGDSMATAPTYADPVQSGQYTGYESFLEQALADPEFARLMADPNFSLGQYFSPHAAGASSQDILSQANTGMSNLMASNPNLQMRSPWTPWSSMEDFGNRQNARGGGFTSGLFDDFSPISDTLGNIANITTLGQGDTALADIFPTVFNPDVHQAAITAGATNLAMNTPMFSGMEDAGVFSGMNPADLANAGNAVSAAGSSFAADSGMAGGTGLTPPTNPLLADMGGGTGLTAGTTTGGIGGGQLGSGLTVPSTGAGAGAGALSPGFFASEGLAPAGGGLNTPGGPSGPPSTGGIGATIPTGLGMARDALGLGSGLYSLYQANQSAGDIQNMLNQTNQQAQQDAFPHSQYRGLVDMYMNDPMALLRNNPAFQASQDYLLKAGQRQQAAKGYTGSGNINYYLADTLGKNANQWWKDAWTPISQAAGVENRIPHAELAGVQANAMNAISNNQRSAAGSAVKGITDFMGSNTGSKVWDWAFG